MTPDPIALVAGLNQNFQLFGGEDKVISVDMTGYDLTTLTGVDWWMATSPYALDTLLSKSLGSGVVANGVKADITIASVDTAAIAPELYYHEMRIVLADGSRKVAMTGNIVLRKSLNPETTP